MGKILEFLVLSSWVLGFFLLEFSWKCPNDKPVLDTISYVHLFKNLLKFLTKISGILRFGQNHFEFFELEFFHFEFLSDVENKPVLLLHTGCHNALVCVEVARLESEAPEVSSPKREDTNVQNITVPLNATPTHLVRTTFMATLQSVMNDKSLSNVACKFEHWSVFDCRMYLSQGLNADETVLSVALVKPDTKLPHIYLFDTRYGIVTTYFKHFTIWTPLEGSQGPKVEDRL